MKHFMRTMANVLDGSHANPEELVDLRFPGGNFDAKFVSVYRNNSTTAHIDVLRANYKSVAALVGDEFFAAICLEYIKKHPAHKRSLVGYGEHFTQFLEDNGERHNLPYLSSFAKLDRAWTLAHIARDAEPLAMSVLEAIFQQGDDLEKLEMSLKPDVFLVSNDWPVFPIWAALRDDEAINDAVELSEQQEHVLVWRYQNEVMYRDLNVGEFVFLNTINEAGNLGQNLGVATLKALEAEPAADVGQLLGGMVVAELFTIEKATQGYTHA